MYRLARRINWYSTIKPPIEPTKVGMVGSFRSATKDTVNDVHDLMDAMRRRRYNITRFKINEGEWRDNQFFVSGRI